MFIIQSIAYADTGTGERDLLIPIVSKIEESRDKSRFIEDPRAVPSIPMKSELAGDATPTENIYDHPSSIFGISRKLKNLASLCLGDFVLELLYQISLYIY